MENDERFLSIKRVFDNDRYMLHCGIEITEINSEYATAEVDVETKHLNANDVVQGGMIYTLADIAYSCHANYLHPMTVTQVGSITYLRAAGCKKMIATAREVSCCGHNATGLVEVKDENGNMLAVAHFNGFVKVSN